MRFFKTPGDILPTYREGFKIIRTFHKDGHISDSLEYEGHRIYVAYIAKIQGFRKKKLIWIRIVLYERVEKSSYMFEDEVDGSTKNISSESVNSSFKVEENGNEVEYEIRITGSQRQPITQILREGVKIGSYP